MTGRHSTSPAAVALDGVQVQSSVQGQVIPLGYGTFRASANLLWYGDFKSIANKQKVGKGGGSTTTSYDYTASLVMGLCCGPIAGIRTVYKDKTVYTNGATTALAQAGFSLASGAFGQSPWGYLSTNHPSQAIGYSGIAYVYAANYALGSSAATGNHTFEVQSTIRVSGLDDANAADIVADFLPRVPFWPAGALADTTDFSTYCLAAGLLVSPLIDNQRSAQDFLRELLLATNCDAVMSDGKLRFVPYGDTAVTGNGVTWTPNLTPIYDLTDSDFIPQSKDMPPVFVDLAAHKDAYNYLQVDFKDRSNQYNHGIAIALDQGAIDQYGRNPNPSPISLNMICDPAVANHAAQLLVQRTANVRAKYRFTLGPHFGLLDPMDLVTITSGDLNRVLVRIVSVDEIVDANGVPAKIDIIAEQMLVGTAHAADYTRQASTPFVPNYAVSPGAIVDFALICPPRTLTNGAYELWVGACGGSVDWGGAEVWMSLEGTNYAKVGELTAAARIGTTTAIPSVADPDMTSTPTINLSSSDGTLLPATQADADHAVTLFLVDTEVMAYRDATLTGAYTYQLGYLRRGLFGTTHAAHGNGVPFVRLDDALAKIAYTSAQVGSTVYVKLLSFNRYGRTVDDISTATAHAVTLTPGAAPVVDVISTDTQNVGGVPSATVLSQLQSALNSIAVLNTEVAGVNTTLAQAEALVAQATDLIRGSLGVTESLGAALIKQSLAHLDLRDLAKSWASLDGQPITVPVAYGKQALALLGVVTDDGSAFVLNGSTAWVSPTQSFAQYQTQLQSNFDNNLALLSTESTTRATADSAISASVTTLAATVSTNYATYQSFVTTQAGLNSSYAASITTLNSSVGSLSATVSANYTTMTTNDAAMASAIIGTSSTLNGSTTSAAITAASLATATGQLYGSITLKTAAGSRVTSMQILSSSGATDLGAVVFDTSAFLVGDSSHSGVAPLYFDASTGTLFSDHLTVRSANIQDLSVQTIHIANGAISNIQGAAATPGATLSTSSETTAETLSYTATGQKVVVIFSGTLGTTTSTQAGMNCRLYCDGTMIGDVDVFCPGSWGGVTSSGFTFHTPSAGSHTYEVRCQATASSGACQVTKASILVMELYK
jgi:hypothetical protein